ncbi:hypothetical protein EJ357_30255 [Streptomyces cyaneochromogenes]|uniref:Uncharacterized protein n=2 Tax=Streptomyces cyaneochromogenes TaxID=2496836 RepID=A0A3Q9EWS1_9ACTN|nr:hypothetical protein EJ357_30255 [Streptomyces cyaneochromogenes]
MSTGTQDFGPPPREAWLMQRRPRELDGVFAVLVGLLDVLLVIIFGYGMIVSGIGAGFDEYADRHAVEGQHDIAVFTGWLAGGGFALAAVSRYWKTAVVHLLLTGLAFVLFSTYPHN